MAHSANAARGSDPAKLKVGALGVVHGDIGRSLLCAIRECVTPPHGVGATPGDGMSRNSSAATDFFSIPPNRVVEIGTQVEL